MIKQLEKMNRGFFWNEISESGPPSKKLHWINWDKVTLPKDMGGLGLTDLNLKNIAQFTKCGGI